MPMSFTPPSQVSIHASAWEATDACWWNPPRWPVSIHASAWEATGRVLVEPAALAGFNPRLRVGGDRPCLGL